jgi:hypothetical protein
MQTKKLHTTLLVIGALAATLIIIVCDKHIAVYTPVIFWGLALLGQMTYIRNIFKLSHAVKNSKPELYKKHSFGIMLSRSALRDKKFLNALQEELHIITQNKMVNKLVLNCIGLFVISAVFIVFMSL